MNFLKKTSKQIDWKYSLREIVLIVVGILIALAINNWNEQRKLYNKETRTLRELKASLENDMVDIRINLQTHENSLKSTELLIEHLKAGRPYHDTLDAHFGELLGSSLFLSDDAAYSSLQNYGRDLISNETLKKKLSLLYAHDYAYIKEIEQIDSETLTHIFLPFYSRHFKDFRLFGTATPIDYTFLLKDPRYLGHLEWWQSARLYTTSRYRTINKKVNELIRLIDTELKSR